MSEKDRLITLDKEQKRQEEKVKKLKEKQLYKQRCRIYDDLVKKQKINSRKIKNAPKDAYISLRHINKIYDNKCNRYSPILQPAFVYVLYYNS